MTLTTTPPAVSCAVRADVPVLAVTEKLMVALPEPLDTAGVSQVASSLTCQVQPAVVVSETLLDPAVAASVTVVGVTL